MLPTPGSGWVVSVLAARAVWVLWREDSESGWRRVCGEARQLYPGPRALSPSEAVGD